MAEGWCGYIDLLGARHMARRDPQLLRDALGNFHAALLTASESFGAGECYAFSDGAFFQCTGLDEFRTFYRSVRNDLFQMGLFFRCSLIPGAIQVTEDGQGAQYRRRRKADAAAKGLSAPGRFFSMTFNDDAPEAYQRESEFKGVGCTVDPKAGSGPDVIETYFVEAIDGRLNARPSLDIRYAGEELLGPDEGSDTPAAGERRLFDPLLQACYAASAQSDRVAPFYISALVAALRSTDLKRVGVEQGRWTQAPYVFEQLTSESVIKALKHVPGVHFLLLSCWDHLYAQRRNGIPMAVQIELLRRIAPISQCFRNQDDIPAFVISDKARRALLDLRVETDLKPAGSSRPMVPA